MSYFPNSYRCIQTFFVLFLLSSCADQAQPEPEKFGSFAADPIGYLDSIAVENNFVVVAGWACDKEYPNEPIKVDIMNQYYDILSVVEAGLQREQAVANLCGGNPFHGFATKISCSVIGNKNWNGISYDEGELERFAPIHASVNEFETFPSSGNLPIIRIVSSIPEGQDDYVHQCEAVAP